MKKKPANSRLHTAAAKKIRNRRRSAVGNKHSRITAKNTTTKTITTDSIAAMKAADGPSDNVAAENVAIESVVADDAAYTDSLIDDAVAEDVAVEDAVAEHDAAIDDTIADDNNVKDITADNAAATENASQDATSQDAAEADIINAASDAPVAASAERSDEKTPEAAEGDAPSAGATRRPAIVNIWRNRLKYSYALYFFVFILTTAATTLILQWSVFEEPDPELVASDDSSASALSVAEQLTKFVTRVWLENNKIFLLNALIIAMLYLVVLFFLNRFWFTTSLLLSAAIAYAIANKFKVQLRDEPIGPADFMFITGGNTNEILSFIPEDGQALVQSGLTYIAFIIGIGILLQILDGRRQFVIGRISQLKVSMKHRVGFVVRIIAFATSLATLSAFCWNLSIEGTRVYDFAYSWQDRPVLFSSIGDAQSNGAVVSFARLMHTDVMETPDNYSQETMNRIAEKYENVANEINAERSTNLTDSTVIMILSESFSDPLRVPGLTFTQDPIPYIRQLKETTTAGLMLSSGYGGGTANMEYQALSGLSMANYNHSLSIAYQQLVPKQSWTPTFNQLWNEEDGTGDSVALHSFFRNMYSRGTVYEKFGFSSFKTIDPDAGSDLMENRGMLPGSVYLSDQASYDNVLTELNNNPDENQFIHLVTMQNHMPYYDWEQGNDYLDGALQGDIDENEREQIAYYANGLAFTDQFTRDFIEQLDQMDRPITVIWYGDHLPSIYSTANADDNNALTLHETDYFIWSNSASSSHETKLDSSESNVVSPNYFMPLAAEHMNAKVTPFLALLTRMHDAIPAMAPASSGGTTSQETVYIDAEGNRIAADDLSEEAKDLLNDYKLVQYDLSAGKSYLKDTSFTSLQ